jgi:hypothetical protein
MKYTLIVSSILLISSIEYGSHYGINLTLDDRSQDSNLMILSDLDTSTLTLVDSNI